MPTILLAEDDIFLQRIYVAELRKAGFEVTAASDGERAIELMKTMKPDLMVLDIIMPHKTGFEVLKEKRKLSALESVPVIMLSSLGQASDIDQAKSLGASGYVVKSTAEGERETTSVLADLEKLMEAIRALLPGSPA